MFTRKLKALEHVNPDSFNIDNNNSYKELIIWLEDQKIRHYKIEDRDNLKATNFKEWNKSLKQYLSKVGCPKVINYNDKEAVVDWLLNQAVSLEYSDNLDKYKTETSNNITSRKKDEPEVINANPLDALDFSSSDFKDGINLLAKLLKITPHPDPVVTLKAVSLIVRNRLSKSALENPASVAHEGKEYPIFETDLGFETGDEALNRAGKALRLLYIDDLRQLQTKINECIVACQTITADPKTDTRIGKVGR